MQIARIHKLIMFLAGVILLATTAFVSYFVYQEDISAQRERASNITQAYSEELQHDFEYGILKTAQLGELVEKNGGAIPRFDKVAQLVQRDYIARVMLVHDDMVVQAYPPIDGSVDEGQSTAASDEEQSAPVMRYAAEHGTQVMQGPVELDGLGRCLIISSPVFLSSDTGEKSLWGFSCVVIQVPAVYDHTLASLQSFGYDYCLDTTTSPLSDSFQRIEFSSSEGKDTLTKPEGYTFEAGECRWSLNVVPQGGWRSARAVPMMVAGLAVSGAVLVLLYLLFRLYAQRKRLHELVDRDSLTGVLSRAGLIERLNEQLHGRPSEQLTVVFLDLDDFKLINDLYGHPIGDAALTDFAHHLEKAFPKNSLIGRTGGDEFCVAIVGKGPDEARGLVKHAIAETRSFSVGGKVYVYTISAGFADYPEQAGDRMRIMRLADEALYAAKLAGKHTCRHYEPSMSSIKRTRLGFSVRNIAAGIPGAFLVYRAHGDEEILFANDDLVRLFDCESLDEFLELVHSSFKHFVHPDDIARVESEIWSQIRAQQSADDSAEYFDDYVEYRIVTKTGAVKHVFDLGRLVDNDTYGEIFYVFLRERRDIGGLPGAATTPTPASTPAPATDHE